MPRPATSRILRDARGSILPMIGVLLGLFCGLMALTFDTGRLGVTHSELQAYADHVALAAAGELDSKPDAIARATAAAAAMVTDRTTYGDGGADFSAADYTLTFYASLPASDRDAATDTTTDPLRARYVHVALDAFDAGFSFGRAFTALTGQADLATTTRAGAVAGMTQYACDITPLMFCIPSADPVTGALWRADDHVGQMIHLRATGNEAWGPGNFGFLDPDDVLVDDEGPCAGLNGGQKIRCVVGAVGSVSQCFAQNGVDTEPGQKVGIEDHAFNVRFDLWMGSMGSKKTDPHYAPAPGVVKGMKPHSGGGDTANGNTGNGGRNNTGNGGGNGNGGGGGNNNGNGGGGGNNNGNGNGGGGAQCIGGNADVSNVAGLPRDTCLEADSCDIDADGSADPYGDGVWDVAGYLAQNHGAVDPRDSYGVDPDDLTESQFVGTRWEMYLAEIRMDAAQRAALAQNASAAPTGSPLIDGLLEERVGPQCSATPPAGPERRVVYVAAVNCDTASGGTEIRGRTNDVPVYEYVKMFLTEPVTADGSTPKKLSIYAEVLGSAGGSGGGAGSPGGTFRDVVQLYR